MLVLIKQEGVLTPPKLQEVIDRVKPEFKELIIPDFSKIQDELELNHSHLNLIDTLMNNYGSEKLSINVLITSKLPKDIIGFITGYLGLTYGIFRVYDDESLQSKVDYWRDDFSIQLNVDKDFLIKKIIELNRCDFKKLKTYLQSLQFNDELEDYVLNALFALNGTKPYFYEKGKSKFMDTLFKYKNLLWS